MPACSECGARIAANARKCPVCDASVDGQVKRSGGKPSAKRKKQSSSGSSLGLILGLVAGGLLMVGGVVAVVMLLPKGNAAPVTPSGTEPTGAESVAAAADPNAVTRTGEGQMKMAPVTGRTRAALDSEGEKLGQQRVAMRNLMQMSLGFENYQLIHQNRLPPMSSKQQPGPAGEAVHSWMTDILPFFEDYQPLYNQIDRKLPWDDPQSAPRFQTVIAAYLNPSVQTGVKSAAGYGLAHFAANRHVISDEQSHPASDITDGLGFTMFVGTVSDGFKAWGDPSNHRDPGLGFGGGLEAFGAPHEGFGLMLMGDGSVRKVSAALDADISRRLGLPADGEAVPANFGEQLE